MFCILVGFNAITLGEEIATAFNKFSDFRRFRGIGAVPVGF